MIMWPYVLLGAHGSRAELAPSGPYVQPHFDVMQFQLFKDNGRREVNVNEKLTTKQSIEALKMR